MYFNMFTYTFWLHLCNLLFLESKVYLCDSSFKCLSSSQSVLNLCRFCRKIRDTFLCILLKLTGLTVLCKIKQYMDILGNKLCFWFWFLKLIQIQSAFLHCVHMLYNKMLSETKTYHIDKEFCCWRTVKYVEIVEYPLAWSNCIDTFRFLSL